MSETSPAADFPTERLILRSVAPEDWLALIEGESPFEQQFGCRPAKGLRAFITGGDVSPEFLALLQMSSGHNPWQWGFAAVEPASDTVIGTAGFKGEPDEAGMVEIAYGVVPSCENRGFATEMAAALLSYASADSRVRLIRAHTLPENNASARVLQKNDFMHLGTVTDPEDGDVWRWERKPVLADIE